MRKIGLLIYLLAAMVILSSCAQSRQVENQAYVLTMGVDRVDNGEIKLTIQVPKIAGKSEDASSGGNSSAYALFSATGNDFESALEKLEWIIPRGLNLSHLKLIVFSENLASEESSRRLLEDIVQTEQLFSAARTVVCRDAASRFIEQTKPVIGSRLSTDITAGFEHYIDQGFLPDSNLADLYYETLSVYSDPMIAYGISSDESGSIAASALKGSSDAISQDTKSEIKNHYIGSALYSEGICVGKFNAEQTLFANLLRGSLKYFYFDQNGQGIKIIPAGAPDVTIELKEQPIRIKICLKMDISAQEDVPDLGKLKTSLEQDLQETIEAAQQMKVEPFGFAASAARQFLTLEEWVDFNWQNAFSNADIFIDLQLRRANS